MKKLFFAAMALASICLLRKPFQQALNRIAPSCPPEEAEDEVEISSEDSFPASDPPSFTSAHA
ncbi:MAG: hypothetical protein KJZ70_00395 [Bryobacterales bacterium]|nr:hypothetical protein [Bryobacterales bacterium]